MKITKLNYFSEYEKLSSDKRSEALSKSHNLLDKLTNGGKDWAKLNSNKNFMDLAEKQFELLERLIQKHGDTQKPKVQSERKKTVTTPTDKSSKVPNRREKAESTANRIRKQLKKHSMGEPVETVDPHLVILTRYSRLNGKTVPRERVIGLARTLVKQIEARVLRKASTYSKIVEQMREQLFEIIERGKGANVRVAIPENTFAAITKAINSERQMKSVQLLRRYAGMAGKLTTIEKAKRLYNAFVSAIENEHIPQDDRYFERTIEVSKILKHYVERQNESKQLPLLPAELSGILGCGCEKDESELNGFTEEDFITEEDHIEQDDNSPARKSSQPICSTDFMHQKFARYPIQEPWVKIFGQVEPGKHTIIFAKEKLGKTTAMVDFAGYLSRNHGSVLFVQKEEELSGTFQDKLEQTRASNPNLYLIEDLPSVDELREYKFVILDSVTRLNLSPSQLLSLQKRLGKDTTIFAIVHATKDGKHRGSNDYVHDAAHIVKFPEFGAAYGRGRFKGHTGELIRFTDPI
jgi:hypothetical protein